ncbi:MAG: hypothetical protein WC516_00955 [Patescibacteria group bacterium]
MKSPKTPKLIFKIKEVIANKISLFFCGLSPNVKKSFYGVLIAGFLARLIVAPFTVFVTLGDYYRIMSVWFEGLNPIPFSTTWGPGAYLSLLLPQLLQKLTELVGFNYLWVTNLVFKIPAITGDVIIFFCLFLIGKKLTNNNNRLSLLVAAMYFLNPLVFVQTAVVGLIHQFAVAFVLLAVLLVLNKKYLFSAIALAFSVSVMFLPLIIFPLIFLMLWKQENFRPILCLKYAFYFLTGIILFIVIPYLAIIIPMFTIFPGVTREVLYNWFVGGIIGGGRGGGNAVFMGNNILDVNNFPTLMSYLGQFGIFQFLSKITHGFVFPALFIPSYAVLCLIILFKKFSYKTFILLCACALILAAAFRPISYVDLFLWILPFLAIAVIIYKVMPRFYLWVLSVLLVIAMYLIYPPFYHFVNTLQISFAWPFYVPLCTALYIFYFLLLLFSLAAIIYEIFSRTDRAEIIPRPDTNIVMPIFLVIYALLFLMGLSAKDPSPILSVNLYLGSLLFIPIVLLSFCKSSLGADRLATLYKSAGWFSKICLNLFSLCLIVLNIWTLTNSWHWFPLVLILSVCYAIYAYGRTKISFRLFYKLSLFLLPIPIIYYSLGLAKLTFTKEAAFFILIDVLLIYLMVYFSRHDQDFSFEAAVGKLKRVLGLILPKTRNGIIIIIVAVLLVLLVCLLYLPKRAPNMPSDVFVFSLSSDQNLEIKSSQPTEDYRRWRLNPIPQYFSFFSSIRKKDMPGIVPFLVVEGAAPRSIVANKRVVISLNGSEVYNSVLTMPGRMGLTLPVDHEESQGMLVPFDLKLLKMENFVDIKTDPGVDWNISGVTLKIFMYIK